MGLSISTHSNTETSILKTVVPIIVGIIFFLTALAFNDAITSTIDYYVNSNEIAYMWIYAVSVFVILIALTYFSKSFIHAGNVKLSSHTNIETASVIAELPSESI